MIDGKTRLLCLLGSPIEHTFSPAMHNASFQKLGINALYMAFDIRLSEIEETLKGLRALNFKGGNVTIPHKVNVMPYLDYIDDKALLIGAVNTIVNKEDGLYGYNTDVDGFLESFKTHQIDLKNKKVAVLGTGGASKAVVVGLLFEEVASIDIFSRNSLKVASFIEDINYEVGKLKPKSYEELKAFNAYDIIVNTTPLGMHPHEGQSVVDTSLIGHEKTVFYDLIYNPLETEFLKGAKKTKRKSINGLEMLVYQGIYALKHWYPELDVDQVWTKEDVLAVLKEQGKL